MLQYASGRKVRGEYVIVVQRKGFFFIQDLFRGILKWLPCM